MCGWNGATKGKRMQFRPHMPHHPAIPAMQGMNMNGPACTGSAGKETRLKSARQIIVARHVNDVRRPFRRAGFLFLDRLAAPGTRTAANHITLTEKPATPPPPIATPTITRRRMVPHVVISVSGRGGVLCSTQTVADRQHK